MPEGSAAVAWLQTAEIGSRVVIRRREEDGFHDALGYLTAIGDDSCVVQTRSGPVTVPLAKVTHAKQVPPPPPRRAPRHPLPD